MADLGTLPSTQILANSPGSTWNRRRGGWSGQWGRTGSSQQQTPQPGGAPQGPQTFAQMQQAKLARPAPPGSYGSGYAPQTQSYAQGSAQTAGPLSYSAQSAPTAAPTAAPTSAPTAAPRLMSAMAAPTGYGAPTLDPTTQYNQAVSNALSAPSRYD